jgi:hypothetical protein
VGALVLGVVDFLAAFCARTKTAVSARMIAIAAMYFVILPSYKNIILITEATEMKEDFGLPCESPRACPALPKPRAKPRGKPKGHLWLRVS